MHGSGNMETPTNPSDSAAAAAGQPRWVLLNRYSYNDDHVYSPANAKTTAACYTSTGRPFAVCCSVAAPPAGSSFHGDWVRCGGDWDDHDDEWPPNNIGSHHEHSKGLVLKIVAAHHDAVLIELSLPTTTSSCVFEYFLYETGAGRRQPPSLSLLPGCYISCQFERVRDARQDPTPSADARSLSLFKDTGILRRGDCDGDGEVLVAQLEVGYDALSNTAELCVLRPGDRDWALRRLPIVRHDGKEGAAGELLRPWEMDATIAVGSRFLCWVDYVNGFLLCDMAEDNENPKYCRNLAAAGPGAAVRFVSVAPRCCCGGPGQTSCERSSSAFNVTTWTLTLRIEEPMAWVKDGMLDCDELWQLPDYRGFPRVVLKYPIVSADDPDIVCFTVCCEDRTVWMVEINTRSKALISAAVRAEDGYYVGSEHLAAKLHW